MYVSLFLVLKSSDCSTSLPLLVFQAKKTYRLTGLLEANLANVAFLHYDQTNRTVVCVKKQTSSPMVPPYFHVIPLFPMVFLYSVRRTLIWLLLSSFTLFLFSCIFSYQSSLCHYHHQFLNVSPSIRHFTFKQDIKVWKKMINRKDCQSF